MYQLTVSVDNSKADWLYSVEDILKNKLKSCFAVSAMYESGRRIYCGFGCEPENKAEMLSSIKDCIIEMYAVVTKFDFIKRNLSINLSPLRYEILLRTLVAFDRENEHQLLASAVDIRDGMTLDGVFNFKLAELRDRWSEICKLTKNNGAYLYDDATYNELLRFLISAVNPKVNKLTICEKDGKYRLTGSMHNNKLDLRAGDSTELMYYLIDLAPLELIIEGRISNSELFSRLIGIFDAKTNDNFGKKTKK